MNVTQDLFRSINKTISSGRGNTYCLNQSIKPTTARPVEKLHHRKYIKKVENAVGRLNNSRIIIPI